MKTIAITGSSGFIGTNLIKLLEKQYNIIRIKREDLANINKLIEIIDQTNIVINLAGASIISRWSDKYKKTLYNSRINSTKNIVDAINRSKNKIELFISTSAIGIYKGDKKYNEDNIEYDNTFLGKLGKDWEKEVLKIENNSIRKVIFRFGIVLGLNGGALNKMLLPFKLGLGGCIGNGNQKFSFIHIKDLLSVYTFIINHINLEGEFNLTSPISTTNYKFTKTLGKILKRPTFINIPEFVLNILLSQGATILTKGQDIYPKRLLESGFKFEFENIENTLIDLLNKKN
jgi:uncharacterized protein